MKLLYLIRHAKSSWAESSIPDYDRPLNKRGKRDAPFMGKLLNKLESKIDLIVSSPAKRTKRTAQLIADELGYDKDNLQWNEDIYLADADEIQDIIKKIDDSVISLMIVAHNPGLTEFCNSISNEELENIPTSGAVKIELEINSWADLQMKTGRLIFFEYPKKYLL